MALTGSLATSGCVGSGCEASNSPGGQVAVCNQKDSFSYSVNAGATSKSDTYPWSNSATKAQVHWAMNIGFGGASVTIKDAVGKQVFTKSFGGTGQSSASQTTSEGTAGDWTIEVRLTGASGQVAFEVNSA